MQTNIDHIFICLDHKCNLDSRVTTDPPGMDRHKPHSVQMCLKDVQAVVKKNLEIINDFNSRNDLDT